MLLCVECHEPVNEDDYDYLAHDPSFEDGDVFIVHQRCVQPDQTVLKTHGELALIRWPDHD